MVMYCQTYSEHSTQKIGVCDSLNKFQLVNYSIQLKYVTKNVYNNNLQTYSSHRHDFKATKEYLLSRQASILKEAQQDNNRYNALEKYTGSNKWTYSNLIYSQESRIHKHTHPCSPQMHQSSLKKKKIYNPIYLTKTINSQPQAITMDIWTEGLT